MINLGFSGNGNMDPEVAALRAELDPAIFVIDCLPNSSPEQVAQLTPGQVAVYLAGIERVLARESDAR